MNNGLYALTSSGTVALTGTNTVAGATRVTINGDDAVVNQAQGTWSNSVALAPGFTAWQNNPDYPLMSPWKVTVPMNNPTQFVMERNPYSPWVDTDGNQLPYIGKLQYTAADNLEVVATRAVAGEYDFQENILGVDKLPVLIDGQTRGGYKVYLDPEQGAIGIMINLAYEDDPEIGEWYRNVDFRRES